MSYVEMPGAKVPIRMWADPATVEEGALQQLRNVATLPWIKGLAVMPDVHYGKGATVGSVIAMRGAVCPAAVGVDIGCGMSAVKTSLTANDLPGDLSRLRSKIEQAIPVGRGCTTARWSRGASTGWRRAAGTTSGAVRRSRRSGQVPSRTGRKADGYARRRKSFRRSVHGYDRFCLADAALRFPQHRQGTGRASHRRRPEAPAQPGSGRPRPRGVRRGHSADGRVPQRPVLGAGVREVQPHAHDGAPQGRGPQGVQEGQADLRAGDQRPPQLRGRGAIRRDGPAGDPQGRDPRGFRGLRDHPRFHGHGFVHREGTRQRQVLQLRLPTAPVGG